MRGAFIILFLALGFLSSCDQNTFDSEKKLITFLKDADNGFFKEKAINGIDISIMYRPIDLLVQQELGSSANNKQIDSIRNIYSNYIYFGLNLTKDGQELLSTIPQNNNEFGAMVNQLSFGMDKVIHLYSSRKDTVEMTDYVYPRMYGYSKTTSMLLVYPRDKKITSAENFIISIEDIGLKTGDVKFKFDTNILNEEPRLSFD